MAVPDTCFHCALPNPEGSELTVDIEGQAQRVCCPACKAVAELIRDSGMSRYYAMRDAPLPGAGKPLPEASEWQVFNSQDMLDAFADTEGDVAEARIYAGGMYCSACSWLIETSLGKVPGVQSVEVNPLTHRLRIRWAVDKAGLGDILANLSNIGYRPQPLAADDASRPEIAEQRAALKRLLVASLGMMQVMMFAVGLYAGDFQGIEADMQRFLRLVSFFVATPVVFYAAKPFFTSAWRGVVTRRPGMDLPVSIAIGSAYAASVYATFTDGPAVWFDSVAMFVFFLTLGRYLEMRARHRSIDRSVALSQLLPNTATVVSNDESRTVPVARLAKDDLVLIRAGDSIPADGVVVSGTSSVDEALLTGEAEPRRRSIGDLLAAGSVNLDAMMTMRVTRTGGDTALGAINRLSERARFTRPAFVNIADRIASYVVVALLAVAVLVAVYWYFVAPDRAFVITLSVLVVTCPCALALATPAAFAAAGSRLSDLRLLLTNGNAIEVLSRATRIVFDKTGTLTSGTPVILSATMLDDRYDESQCRRIAAALEQASSHPIARAFRSDGTLPLVTDTEVHVSQGVSGIIDGKTWRIGNAPFVTGGDAPPNASATIVYLGFDAHAVARFELSDALRADARDTLDTLQAMGKTVSLVSGDNAAAVAAIARALGIDDAHSDCRPEDKLRFIRSLQERGERVVMIGDGINDAPVLAGADTSIAPGHGALLAQTNADVIMLGDSLQPITTAIRLSAATMRIVRQNLTWAVVYNATALPLAAAGMVPPWLAAIGMSFSSLVVVLNALRLNRYT
ncbi:MAG: heavy metal translocating P-type ATPase [Gammaproteobacteria bacterium]|nr:heavy metal translocating P-type ATPase [Gammaproteobacteria bacterium]